MKVDIVGGVAGGASAATGFAHKLASAQKPGPLP